MMSTSTARVRLAPLLGVLFLVCLTLLHREAAAEEKEAAKDLPRIGFSNLVVRIPGQDQIGLASRNDRVFIIERLRKLGFNMVGAESLVFEKDRTNEADFLLGGTLNELDCEVRYNRLSCRIGIEWEVLDVRSDEVRYRTTTRASRIDFNPERSEQAAQSLILGAVESLAERRKLRKLVRQPFEAPKDQTFAPATFRSCSVPSPAMPANAEKALDATVLVSVDGGHGSGFLVSPDGLVITAAHVVDRARKISVKDRRGGEHAATLLRVSAENDIAILKTDIVDAACLVGAVEAPAIGREVYVLGAPASEELSFSLSRGIVSGLRQVGKATFIQTDASVNPGNSGGPMLNDKGEVVGVVSRKLVGTAVEGLAFATAFGESMTALGLLSGTETAASLLQVAAAPVAELKVISEPADAVPSLNPAAEAAAARARKRRELEQAAEREEAASRARERARLEEEAARAEAEQKRRDEEAAAAAARVDAVTPFGMKALRWSSVGVAGAGTVLALTSLLAVQPKTSAPEFYTLATLNEVGWIAAAVGAATFGVSLAFIPPDPKDKAHAAAQTWQVVPSPFQPQGAF